MTAKTIENKLNKEWKDICRDRNVPKRCERSFVATSTSLASFHYLIKTHKAGPLLKIRPIVANKGSPTEKIAWLLSRTLSPLLKDVSSHVPSSDSLMEAISNVTPETLSRHRHQCSLDVVALYTSVPVVEALEAVRAKLSVNANLVPHPLQIEDLIRLLSASFKLTYFHHEGKIYRQIAGLPMGSAVSGIVAILFMDSIERRALNLFARCPFFKRYVDDCYVLLESAQDAQEIQQLFNSQHPAIKFELEECTQAEDATSTTLSLLDLTVTINSTGEASYDFYTKSAKSDIFIHKDSSLPWNQKTAAIRNEAKRIEARSGNNRARNLATFERKLQHNGYSCEDIQRARPSRNSTTRTRPSGRIFYLDLPYLGEGTEHKVRSAFAREGITIRTYRKSTTVLDVVRPRQTGARRCPWETCTTKEAGKCFIKNCVYELTCTPCGRRYVGSTTRPVHERIREHTTTGRGSTIHSHLLACGGGTAKTRVRIVAREKDEVNTRLREVIVIKKLQPELNTQEESDLIDLVF